MLYDRAHVDGDLLPRIRGTMPGHSALFRGLAATLACRIAKVRPVIAHVALGSNLGDRLAALRGARAEIDQEPGLQVLAASRVYETDPVGPGNQGLYLNAVLAVESTLSPRSLLDHLLAIEARSGRRRDRGDVRWGPRVLDLDLLLFGDHCIEEPGLEIPHPRLHERPFVLQPLCDLAGDLEHPRLGGRFVDWASRCPGPGAARLVVAIGEDWQVGLHEGGHDDSP